MNINSLAQALSKTLKPMVKNALINGGGFAGSAGAKAIGMPGASATMNAVGRNLGARISKLIGSGDYAFNDTVTVNSLIKPKGANVNSSFASSGVMPTRIRHREYVGDIATGPIAGAFSVTSFAINPGLSDSFPYLSNIAQNYDQYVFHGLVYEFVSSTGSPNTGAMGTVILAADYNPTATTYSNKHNMENSGYAVSARLDGNIMYGIECAAGESTQNGYFVRTGSSSLGLESTDYGNMQVAVAPSSSFPTNAVLGELWVTYDVELKRPSLSQNRYGYFHTIRGSYVPSTAPLGTLVAKEVKYGSCSNITVEGNTISFDRVNTGDVYRLTVTWTATVAAAITYPTFPLQVVPSFILIREQPPQLHLQGGPQQAVAVMRSFSLSRALIRRILRSRSDPVGPSPLELRWQLRSMFRVLAAAMLPPTCKLLRPASRQESGDDSDSSYELPEHTPLDRPVYVFHTTVRKYPTMSIVFRIWLVSAWLFSLLVLISLVAQMGHLARRFESIYGDGGFCRIPRSL